jgi:hypothetical protein
MLPNIKKLKRVLNANAVFSTVSGLLLIFDKPLIDKMGIGNYLTPLIIGIGLLIFGVSVFYISRRLKIVLVKFIIIQDLVWVLLSIVALVIRPWELTGLGYGLIAAVALTIGSLTLLQKKYL